MSYEDQPLDYEPERARQYTSDAVASKVRIPAIFLIMVGILNVLGSGYWLIVGLLAILNPELERQGMNMLNPNQTKEMEKAGMDPLKVAKYIGIGRLTLSAVAFAAAALTILGAIRMLSLRNRGLAIFGSILAAIPCVSIMGCCGIGEGIGIWALIVLVSPDVKAVFQ